MRPVVRHPHHLVIATELLHRFGIPAVLYISNASKVDLGVVDPPGSCISLRD